MTIEDRVDDLCYRLLDLEGKEYRQAIKEALLKAMRDQKAACVKAVQAVEYGAAAYGAAVTMKIKCEQAVAKAEVK